MKSSKIYAVLTMFLLLGTAAFAQPKVNQGPQIEFEKSIHDYGDIPYDGDGVCTFVFTNTGNAPLIITDAKKSCGCTVPSWPKEPIAPGQSAEIKVKYDTKRSGMINKSVSVISNAVNEPTSVLRIKGRVGVKDAAGVPVNKVAVPTK